MSDIINKNDVVPIEDDPCGTLRELYNSDNISISHDIVMGTADKHKHKYLEEIYYVIKGKGQISIGDKITDINEGDTIPIPKDVWHYLIKTDSLLEVLVVTHPRFNQNDLILSE